MSKEDILEVGPPCHLIISTEPPGTMEQRRAMSTVPLPNSFPAESISIVAKCLSFNITKFGGNLPRQH